MDRSRLRRRTRIPATVSESSTVSSGMGRSLSEEEDGSQTTRPKYRRSIKNHLNLDFSDSPRVDHSPSTPSFRSRTSPRQRCRRLPLRTPETETVSATSLVKFPTDPSPLSRHPRRADRSRIKAILLSPYRESTAAVRSRRALSPSARPTRPFPRTRIRGQDRRWRRQHVSRSSSLRTIGSEIDSEEE